MQGLDKKINEYFELEVKYMVPYRDGFIANTSHGRKIIKKTLFSPERILFVHGAKEHLYNRGFTNIDRYVCTSQGEPGFFMDNLYFTVSDYIEGRECNLENDDDVLRASRTLAELHEASKGYSAPEGSRVQDDTGKLPALFTKRLEDIKKLRKHAHRGKGRFDMMFLKNADHFIKMGEDAITRLKNSNYNLLVEKCRKEKSFCHHDYTHYNIIETGNEFSVINFDYCCYELKIYDLANFIRRRMRKCNWNPDKCWVIFEGYSSKASLDKDELEILELLLLFPQKFWRVVNKYYNSRRSWSEKIYMGKLQEVIDETVYHCKFMEQYSKITAT